MALLHLTDEQVQTWSREQKDRWWLENVFKGDMPQLTLRSALTGFLLGGILSATGLYIGAKTGIGVGVGLTSVILAFALYRALANSGMVKDFSILENNCTQSIATASGYVVSPLYSSLAAVMVVTGTIIPWWQLMIWLFVVSLIGVMLAFPLKRKFINDDQAPFPEGRACGVVLDSLYTGNAGEGMFKAKLLGYVAGGAALYQALVSTGWMKLVQFKVLMLDKWAGVTEVWHFQERLDQYYYTWAAKADGWIPTILGTDVRQLGMRLTLDVAMIGVGGLMGIAVATSCLIGGLINFGLLAPLMIQLGDIVPRTAADGSVIPINRAEIVNQWSLWWGVTMMVVGALVGLLAKPEMFKGLFKRGKKTAPQGEDVLKHIEVPLWVSYVGVPITSIAGAWVTHAFFGVPFWIALISLPLIFVLTIIGTNSVALTSWVPTGAMSKITQFTMGAIDRANPASNLMPAAMTSEIASNTAHLLSDIKPGYMLGGKPRHQAIGHVIGNVAGIACCVPLFFLLFLPADVNGVRSTATIFTDQFAMPAALQWKGVSDLIANGLTKLPPSALISMAIAAIAAIVIELLRLKFKGKFGLSAVAIGLGVVLPPEYTFTMWVGALLFWFMGRKHKTAGSKGHRIWVDGLEPICAGLIAGAALMGIGNAILNVVLA